MRKICERCKGYGRVKQLGGVEKVCPKCNGARGFEIEKEKKEIETEKNPETKSVAKRKKTQREKPKFELGDEQ
jgi:DnaJ-class molecular chaperone